MLFKAGFFCWRHWTENMKTFITLFCNQEQTTVFVCINKALLESLKSELSSQRPSSFSGSVCFPIWWWTVWISSGLAQRWQRLLFFSPDHERTTGQLPVRPNLGSIFLLSLEIHIKKTKRYLLKWHLKNAFCPKNKIFSFNLYQTLLILCDLVNWWWSCGVHCEQIPSSEMCFDVWS